MQCMALDPRGRYVSGGSVMLVSDVESNSALKRPKDCPPKVGDCRGFDNIANIWLIGVK